MERLGPGICLGCPNREDITEEVWGCRPEKTAEPGALAPLRTAVLGEMKEGSPYCHGSLGDNPENFLNLASKTLHSSATRMTK